jgi:glycosyltransferase involved in cell wall biosynthesis
MSATRQRSQVGLTVAVCTYNPDLTLLSRVLDAACAQLRDLGDAELVVVDNNSAPALDEAYFEDHGARLVREPTPGLTAAREAAIEAAAGALILFVDDDTILGDGYLARAAQAFADDPSLGVLGGRVEAEFQQAPPRWFEGFEHYLAIKPHPPELRVETTAPPYTRFFPVGAGMVVRRDLAERHAEDARQTSRIEGRRGNALTSGEDSDLTLFALSAGYKLLVDGSLRLTHVISPERLQPRYLQRIAVSHLRSSFVLDQKWASRLGVPVYPELKDPFLPTVVKSLVLIALAPFSPRYRVKRALFVEFVRIRVRRRLGRELGQ